MDDIEKLKAENSDLRTKVADLKRNEYSLEGELRKASQLPSYQHRRYPPTSYPPIHP